MPETPAKAGLFRPTFGFFREVIFNQILTVRPIGCHGDKAGAFQRGLPLYSKTGRTGGRRRSASNSRYGSIAVIPAWMPTYP